MASAVAAEGRFPVSRVAEVLGVSRSQVHARAAGTSSPRGPYCKAEDAELLPALRHLVDARPTYGYRRIAALLNRERRAAGLAPINRKRVLRILGQHGLTLERCTGRREGRLYDGKVAVMASDPAFASGLGPKAPHWLTARMAWRSSAGTARRSASPSSSMPSIARSSLTWPWRGRASPDRMSAT